jgi:hypothetical protein
MKKIMPNESAEETGLSEEHYYVSKYTERKSKI